jgi:hypothetical protein
MALRETQQAIADWIRAPEGVAAALAEEDSASMGVDPGSASRRLADLIRSDAALDATGRLEIYANAYFGRILGVLSSDYPALSSAMGTNAFNDLVTSYLLVEPSSHPSLRYAGARLASFISSHEAAAGIRARDLWASDLATLEWARVEVFDAIDGVVLARASLASLAPESFGSLSLRLGPWVRFCHFEHPVDRIWKAAMGGTGDARAAARLADEAECESTLLIWRKDEAVLHRRVERPEADALELTHQGITFEGLCEWAATQVGEEDAPAKAAGWLETWLADGLLGDPFATDGGNEALSTPTA